MFPLATSLPKMDLEKSGAVEKPHYTSFSPRRVKSGWKTAESVSQERMLGRTLSTMNHSARFPTTTTSTSSEIIMMTANNDQEGSDNFYTSFTQQQTRGNNNNPLINSEKRDSFLQDKYRNSVSGEDLALESPRTQALRVSNSFILEEGGTSVQQDMNLSSPAKRNNPAVVTKTDNNFSSTSPFSPIQQPIVKGRSMFVPGDDVMNQTRIQREQEQRIKSGIQQQQQLDDDNKNEHRHHVNQNDNNINNNGSISSENRKKVEKRRSIIAAANIGEIVEWDPVSLQEEVFTEEDREAIAETIYDYMNSLLDYAVKVLPPPPDVDDDNAKGLSELSTLTLRKLLPTLKRKLLGTGGDVENNNNRNFKNNNNNYHAGSSVRRNPQRDVMGRLAPEWLVNGKTLHTYAIEHLDTLLVRSILSLPDCPHIRNVLFLHIPMTPSRIALLLHKGFGSSSSRTNETITSQFVDEKANTEVVDDEVPVLDDDEEDNRDPLQRALDDGAIPLMDDHEARNKRISANHHHHQYQLDQHHQSPHANSSLGRTVSRLSSLCLAFCLLESGSVQILCEWITFAPSASSLTALDLSHNKLENRIVPQILRALQRRTIKHLNLRGNAALFVGTVGNLGSQLSDGRRKFNHNKDDLLANDSSSSNAIITNTSSSSHQHLAMNSGLRLTKSVIHSSSNSSVAYLPVTPAVFLENTKDILTTLELSLCGVSADHMMPIVHSLPRYNFASLSLDSVDMSSRAAATLLENLTQNTSLVHLSLKFISTCSAPLYQERVTHLLSRNLELLYDSKIYQPMLLRFGDEQNTEKRVVVKAAQTAFLDLQPHFSTGTPTDLLKLIRESSLQYALQGQLVPTMFVMRKTVNGRVKIRGTNKLNRVMMDSAPLVTSTSTTNPPQTTTSSPNSMKIKDGESPSERVARQLARDEDEESVGSLMDSEMEREAHISSALPPGFGAFYSNEPTKQLQRLQFMILKKRDEEAAALVLELQQQEQIRKLVKKVADADDSASVTSATSTSASTSTSTATGRTQSQE